MSPFVLVVDDDPLILELAAAMLEELGCRAMTSLSASDALRLLKERPEITTLLSDVQMPGTNGVELAVQARRLRTDLHVVLASGRERIDGFPFLRKPFNREDLSRLVGC